MILIQKKTRTVSLHHHWGEKVGKRERIAPLPLYQMKIVSNYFFFNDVFDFDHTIALV